MNKNKILINIGISAGLLIVICMIGVFTFAEELKPIELSAPQMDRGKLLMQALKERQSNRDFSDKELPLDVISNLLWAASGVNRPDSGKLTAPTTKNWQEIDIYVADHSRTDGDEKDREYYSWVDTGFANQKVWQQLSWDLWTGPLWQRS